MKKTTLSFAAILLFSVSLFSQMPENPFSNQYIAVVSEGMQKTLTQQSFKYNLESWLYRYGFIDLKKKQTIPCIYDAAGNFSSGLAPVCINRRWGYIDKKGKTVIPLKYEAAGNFSEGLAPVVVNGKMGFIDTRGTFLIPPAYISDIPGYYPIAVSGFANGMAPVTENALQYYYIDKTGKKVMGPFLSASKFRNGYAAVSSPDRADKTFTLTERYKMNGLDFEYDEYGNLIVEGHDTIWSAAEILINTQGQKVTGYYYDTLPGNLFVIKDEKGYAIFGKDIRIPVNNPRTVIVTPVFISTDLTRMYKRDGTPLKEIKPSGKNDFFYISNDALPFSYTEHIRGAQNSAMSGGNWYLCDVQNGIAVRPDGFTSVEPLGNNLWIVMKENGRAGVITTEGKEIVPPGTAVIEKTGNKWWVAIDVSNGTSSLYDMQGNRLHTGKYTRLYHLWGDYFICQKESGENNDLTMSLSGVINSKGDEVLPARYEYLTYLPGGLIAQGNGEGAALLTLEGKEIIPYTPNAAFRSYDGVIQFESAEGVRWLKPDGTECNDGASFSFEIYPSVTLTRSNVRFTKNIPEGGKWTVAITGNPALSAVTFDSLAFAAGYVLAFSPGKVFLISSEGKAAGPYSGITQPQSTWNDSWFLVNNGGILKTKTAWTETVFLEDFETGEFIERKFHNYWNYFEGGKNGIIDNMGNELIQPGYDKIALAVQYERFMEGYYDNSIEYEYRQVLIADTGVVEHCEKADISKKFPAMLYRGDSVSFHFWNQRPDIKIKGNEVENYYSFYLISDKKTGTKRILNTYGSSSPFHHFMRLDNPQEMMLYLVNEGGKCDTLKRDKTEYVDMWSDITGEPETREITLTEEFACINGGKFHLVSNTGNVLNESPFEQIKMMTILYGFDVEILEYKDLSDCRDFIYTIPTVSTDYPFQIRKGNKWGLMNCAGQEILPARYDSLQHKKNKFIANESFFAFRADSVFTLDPLYRPVFYSLHKALPVPNIKIEMSDFENNYFDPLYLTCSGCGVDSITSVISEISYNIETWEEVMIERTVTRPVMKGGKTGLVNHLGIPILPNEYDDIRFFQTSPFRNQYPEISATDSTGAELTRFADVGPVCIKVRKNQLWGLVSVKGEMLAEPLFTNIELVPDTENDGKYYLLTLPDGTVKKLDTEGKEMK